MANAWLPAPLCRRQYIIDNQDTLSIKRLRKLLEGDLGREQGALDGFKALLRELVDQVCLCRPFPPAEQRRVTTRLCLPSAGIPPHPCGVPCADRQVSMCLLQVLHEPPAKKLKQAAAQPERAAPAQQTAKPAAGTRRKEEERRVRTCITTTARLGCHVVSVLLGAASAASEEVELVFMHRPPCRLQLQVAAGRPLCCMASHITAATICWCLTCR